MVEPGMYSAGLVVDGTGGNAEFAPESSEVKRFVLG